MPRIVMITDEACEVKEEYLRRHGWHFSPAAEEYAATLMGRRNAKGGVESIEPFSAKEVDALLNAQGVTLGRSRGLRQGVRRQHVQGRLLEVVH